LSRAFAFRLITELRPVIRPGPTSSIDQVESRSEMDFVDDFAAPIPAHIISEILGSPEEDIPEFTRWVYSISRAVSFSFLQSDIPDMEDAARNLTEYVQNLLSDRRATPRLDFLSSYVLNLDTG